MMAMPSPPRWSTDISLGGHWLYRAISILLTVLTVLTPCVSADPPTALPQRATENDLKWQPALDYDRDGCYNVPAIDAEGNISEGLDPNFTTGPEDCRDESDLDNSNAYSRQRCNSGWCVYLYGYYFEKDVAIEHVANPGHRHDWEHIAVWVKDDKAEYVGASAHGSYNLRPADEVRWDGTHPKMVYHKDGGSTHAFRFGNTDDDNVENHKGVWVRSPLVSYNGFPDGIRDQLFAYDFGAATIAFKDETFASNLEKAMPKIPVSQDCSQWGACHTEFGDAFLFDYGLDEGSPGTPDTPPPPQTPLPKLRVLPLGDSLTFGVLSTDGNGYRRQLHQLLVSGSDNEVDFVGSQESGTMTDNQHEGYPGATIAQITQHARNVLYMRPNVILIHAGTNDLHKNVDIAGAPTRLGSLIDLATDECPDAAVLVAQIIMAVDSSVEADRAAFNEAVVEVVASRQSAGKNVMIADMSQTLARSDFVDGLHPNNGGYDKMAAVWYETIQAANKLGWVKDPVAPGNAPPADVTPTCPNGYAWLNMGEVGTGINYGMTI